MAKGIDCATRITAKTAELIAADGNTFVGRYLADKASWKRLSPEEAQTISDAGLYVVSFYERYADRVREGSVSGVIDGKLALQYAKEVGQPAGTTIYAAVDYDAQSADYAAIEAYIRAFDAEITGYELGIYGSYFVVKAMHERGVANKLAQTVAWSKGKRYAPACFYQAQIDVTRYGINVDIDETNGDAGGWRVGMVIEQPKALSEDDAKGIIAVLGDYWRRMDGNKPVQDYAHYLANQVRKAAGIPLE